MENGSAERSDQFGPAKVEALAKAGTVMLPYPPPASGRLYVGINPDSNPDFDPYLPAGPPKFFLRLVETVSPKKVVTWIVGLQELSGISLPTTSAEGGKTSRTFHTVNDREIAKKIKEATRSLMAAENKERGVYEVCLFEDAVIFVPEPAPTLIQVHEEFGVTAAEAAQNVDRLATIKSCWCSDLTKQAAMKDAEGP